MTEQTQPTDADLKERCAEIVEWQRTGVLHGSALRNYAGKHWAGHTDALQMAERDTSARAMELIAKWGTPAGAGEVVAWQSRCRPTWGNNHPWTPWELCTKGQAEDYQKTPLLHDWEYEARALYTTPQPTQAQAGAPRVSPEQWQALFDDQKRLVELANSRADIAESMLKAVQEQAGAVPLPKFLALKFHARRDKKATVTLLFQDHEAADAWVRGIRHKGADHG